MARAETLDDLASFARDGHFATGRLPRVVAFRAPRRVRMGEEVALSWRVEQASRIELWLGGALEDRRVVPHTGRWSLRAAAPGHILAELRCWGVEQDAVAEPGCIQTLDVEVTAPPVQLRLGQRELRGSPGATARLHWAAEGAAQVFIRRPLHDDGLEVPSRGAVELVLDAIEDVVHVTAVGHDGVATVTETCRLRPICPARDDIAHELNSLLSPLEELRPWN